jgi:hypothetical protein
MSFSEKRRFSRDAYVVTAAKVGPDVAARGREEIRATNALHPLVDPAGFNVIRRSLHRHIGGPRGLLLRPNGLALLIESLLDGTGSVGADNHRAAFAALPDLYKLVAKAAPYFDPQIMNAVFGDAHNSGWNEQYYLQRTQAEMAEQITEQLQLLVPQCNGGGNGSEDPDLGLFGAAYLTDAAINDYGLKWYHFTTTDEPPYGSVEDAGLRYVFGDQVYSKAAENGHHIDQTQPLRTEQIVTDLLGRAHAFVLIIPHKGVRGGRWRTDERWVELYGRDRVLYMEDISLIAYFQALIVGLTEGTVSLDTAEDFLSKAGCNRHQAERVVDAVAGIPLRAQAMLPGYQKIPPTDALFRNKRDTDPVDPAQIGGDEDDILWS